MEAYGDIKNELVENYQLRYAAGRYFLLDMKQSPELYRKPLQLNTTGARIFNMLAEGISEKDIVDRLYSEYQEVPDAEDIRQDVRFFIEQLEKYTGKKL